jgi:hypothetical protein
MYPEILENLDIALHALAVLVFNCTVRAPWNTLPHTVSFSLCKVSEPLFPFLTTGNSDALTRKQTSQAN